MIFVRMIEPQYRRASTSQVPPSPWRGTLVVPANADAAASTPQTSKISNPHREFAGTTSVPLQRVFGALGNMRIALLALMFLALSSTLPAQTPVATGFQPDRIVLGQNSMFLIQLSGDSQLEGINLPQVDGLRITYVGPDVRVSFDGSGARRTVVLQFTAQPNRVGTFEMPAFTLRVNDRDVTVPAARLTVIPPQGLDSNATLENIYSMEVVLPERPIWVGEDLPVTARLRVDGAIEVVNLGNFVVDGQDFGNVRVPGDVNRGTETGAGNPQRVLDVPLRLTPLKAGTWPLRTSIVAEMRFPRSGARSGGLPSFFRDFESRQIESPALDVAVRALPEPAAAGFSGGLGRFAARLALEPATVQVGEPLTVTLTVTGAGNFERLQAPTFAADGRWRTYEPRAEFTAADQSQNRGTKVFTYTLIPLDAAVTTIPELPFSTFDPEIGLYVPLPLASLPVTVTPAPDRPAAPPPITRSATDTTPANELLPDTLDLGRTVAAITPDFMSPRLWLLYGWPAPVLAVIALVGWWRRRVADPDRRARAAFHRRLHSALKEAQGHAQRGDAAAFHAAAAVVLRLLAGRKLALPAEALTAAEVDAGLGQLGLDESERARARRLLAAADLFRYGGTSGKADDLGAALTELEAMVRRHGV